MSELFTKCPRCGRTGKVTLDEEARLRPGLFFRIDWKPRRKGLHLCFGEETRCVVHRGLDVLRATEAELRLSSGEQSPTPADLELERLRLELEASRTELALTHSRLLRAQIATRALLDLLEAA